MRWYRSIKMTLGFSLAIVLANLMGLNFALSAGIIALLNMLDTRRESLRVTWRRLYSSALGLMISAGGFIILGQTQGVLMLVVGLFIPLAFKINAREGIPVHIVLASHLLLVDLDLGAFMNEYGLVLIGSLIALVLNVHMPNKEKNLQMVRDQVERDMKNLLHNFGLCIQTICPLDDNDALFISLEGRIKGGLALSYEYMNNFVWKDQRLYLEYFQMRHQQIQRLSYMFHHIYGMNFDQDVFESIGNFVKDLAEDYSYDNDGQGLMEDLRIIQEDIHGLDLPESQESLDQRCAMVNFLKDLEVFINLKIIFSKKYLNSGT